MYKWEEDDFKMHLMEAGYKGMIWILDSSGSVQGQVRGSYQNGT
jgi:hypothetical protein